MSLKFRFSIVKLTPLRYRDLEICTLFPYQIFLSLICALRFAFFFLFLFKSFKKFSSPWIDVISPFLTRPQGQVGPLMMKILR